MLEGDGRTASEETKPERISVMTLAGDGGGARRRRSDLGGRRRRLSCLFSCRLFPNPTKRNASQADKRRTDGRGGGGSGEALISL